MSAKPTTPLTTLLSSSHPDHAQILTLTQPPAPSTKSKPTRPPDLQSLHTHLVALLKLDRHEDALKLLEGDFGEELKESAGLEYAYALYKCGRLGDARGFAEGFEEGGRGGRHVEAQVAYRSEDFARAAEIYRGLWEGNDAGGDEESDLRIQSGATDALLEWKGRGELVGRKRGGREDLEAFETAYNAACGAIARGELGKGEVLLRTARGLCASLDELTEGEKAAEILPIMVQQLYVLGMLGKMEEAEKLSKEIVVQDIPDASTRQIAQHNILAVTPSSLSNPYRSHRLINAIPTLPKNDTLFSHQFSVIDQNKLTLDLLASKHSAVKKSTSRSLSSNPSPTLDPHTNALSVLNAAAHTADANLAKLALKNILPLLTQRPTDIGLVLIVIQLHIQSSNHKAATTILETLLHNISTSPTPNRDEILNSPGLTALLVSLYTAQNRLAAATTALANAASYWLHRPQKEQRREEPTSLFRAAALNLLTSPPNPTHKVTALDLFTHLHKTHPDDKFAHWGYIASSHPSLLSPAAPTTDHISPPPPTPPKSLPPLTHTLHPLNPLALEAAGIPAYPPPSTTQTTLSASSGEKKRKQNLADQQGGAKKKKRVRVSKRPKDFVEGKVGDSERWLPLRERSGYRPKGKKRRDRAVGQGTQGGVEKEKVAVPVVAAAPTVGGGGGGKAKAKKKGKK